MTVTADQAKMLTTLGLAMRPYAAPRFDGRGLHAQIVRVERMSLAEVTQVVVAVCTDPSLETPANIGDTKSRHWDAVHVIGAESRTRDVAPVGSRCTTCGLAAGECRSRWSQDHELTRPRERDVDLSGTIAELKGHIAHPGPPTEQRSHTPNQHAATARALLHADPTPEVGDPEEVR